MGHFGGNKSERLKKIYGVHKQHVDNVNITQIHILLEVEVALACPLVKGGQVAGS